MGVVTGVEIKWLLDSWRFFQMSFFPNLLIIKKSPSRIALSPLLLSVTRYLSSSHVSLQYSLLWKKVYAKWFYSIASSWPYSSFTKADMNTYVTGFDKTRLRGIFYISRNTILKYSSHSGSLMPNCIDARFTA